MASVSNTSWLQNRKKSFLHFRREMDNMSLFFLLITVAFFGLFLIIPLGLIVIQAFIVNNAFSLQNFIDIMINDPSYQFINLNISEWGLDKMIIEETRGKTSIIVIKGIDSSFLINTLFVGFFTTIFAVFFGVLFAFIMAKYDFFGKEVVRLVIIIPLVIPPFIGAIGLKRMFGTEYSVFNNIFYRQLGILPSAIIVEGLVAVIIVQVFHFYTLVYLNSLSAFMNIDPTLEEQAENLGSSGFFLFRKITFPLALPGIAAGAILTFILSVEDLGTPLMFGDTQSNNLLAPRIFFNVISASKGPFHGPTQVYSVIMLMISMVGFLFIRKYVSLRQYATYSKGGTFNLRVKKISSKSTLLFYLVFIPFSVFSLLPHIGTFLISVSDLSIWNPTRGDPFPITIDPRIFGLIILPILVYLLLVPFKKYKNLKIKYKLTLLVILIYILFREVIDTINYLYKGLNSEEFVFLNRRAEIVGSHIRPAFGPDIMLLFVLYWVLLLYLIFRMIFLSSKADQLNIKGNSLLLKNNSQFFDNVNYSIVAVLMFIGVYALLATAFIWEHYLEIFTDDLLFSAAVRTIVIALIAVFIIIILGISASYILARKNFFGKSFVDTLVTIPIAVPGVVLAMGYMVMAYSIESALGGVPGRIKIENPFLILVIAFAIRRFPFTVRAAYAGLQQTHVTFDEAAYNLGASPPTTLIKIIIPLIGSNIFAGALVSFVYSLGEASTTLVWIQNDTVATIPYLIFSRFTNTLASQNSAAALGMMLIFAQVIAIGISNYILKKRGSALTGL